MTNPATDLDVIPANSLYKIPKNQSRYQQPQVEKPSYEGLDAIPAKIPRNEESTGKFIGRTAARSAARAAEAIVGLPGDIRDFITGLTGKGVEALGIPNAQEDFIKAGRNIPVIGTSFPSSSQIRENITQPVSGQYLEPKSSGEEISDEVVGDLATLLLPIKGKVPFLRAIGMTVGSNLGKQAIQSIGGSDTQAQFGKLGLMFLLGGIGRGSAKKYANNLFREAIDSIPSDAKISNQSFIAAVNDFISNLQKGGLSPQKQPAYSLARQLKEKLRRGSGELEVNELPAFRKSINDYRFNRKAGLTDAGRFYLDRFDDIVNKQLMEYGKENPSFLKKYRDANIAVSGFKQSTKLGKYISKHYDINNLRPETLVLLGLHLSNPSILKKIGAGWLGAKGVALAKRMTTNPVLRKYYANVIKNGLEENSAGLARNLEKLNEELGKEPS